MDTILDDDSDDAAKSERSERSETDRMWLQIDPAVYARLMQKEW